MPLHPTHLRPAPCPPPRPAPLQRTRPIKEGAEQEAKAEQELLASKTSTLKYNSRLDWGSGQDGVVPRNFYTGAPAPAILSRQIPGSVLPA